MVRDALAKTRSRNLLDSPGWESHFSRWADGLNQFVARYQDRFQDRPDPIGLLHAAPAKGAAFWELDTLRLSTEMKVAVWRVLLGSAIASLRVDSGDNSFSLQLVLQTRDGATESYESQHSEDIRLLRHLGTIEVGDRTRFQGYYAFA